MKFRLFVRGDPNLLQESSFTVLERRKIWGGWWLIEVEVDGGGEDGIQRVVDEIKNLGLRPAESAHYRVQ